MADNERSATIYTVTDEKLNITFFVGETIEDLCIKVYGWSFFLLLNKIKFSLMINKNFSDNGFRAET